ncbi:hypothetical protein A5634_00835 [Mycobacterium asiaticum]|uniref:PE domain-containing protein n=1 Tax=Mycobacterium asiaticum TaxID=1790 RepID=A0A1A3PBE6_MYCAS|nr:PE family protein [Mycobacterium asiaticum]OBK31020.1 hypothetical protein A5634_00835 [Mycobacterium asiaticum]
MSYVIAAPDLMQGAAQDLAGLRASLAEATATLTGPTTGIAAAAQDEISTAVAALFGSFGEEFQAINTQVHEFHQQFVGSLNAGAAAYASAEAASLPALAATGLGSVQTLLTNTVSNLQSLQSAVMANPAPLLRQFVTNQAGYAQAIVSALQNPPSLLSLLPTNPAALVQGFVNQQIGYAQTVSTALTNAARDFGTGVMALPTSLQTALGQLAAGDVPGAVRSAVAGFGNLFFTGLSATQDPTTFLINISPTGSLGDLLPILTIPGQMAQNFTDLLPTGSVPFQISQHVTNVVKTLTDTSQTLDLNTGVLHVGSPLVLGLDALGPAITTLNGIGSSASAVANALQTGDVLGATTALLNAPATILDSFLNGQGTLPLSVSLGDLTTTTNLPVGGLLTPAQFASLTIDIFGTTGTIPLFGTQFGGIIPGLLTFLPEQLAEAIGAPAFPV